MHNPLIVALDVPDAERALRLATSLAHLTGALKVGSELFTTAGPDLVRRLRATGARVFLDLKFHDIPHTVARAVAAATRLDVQLLTVHTSGGAPMLRAALESAADTARSLNLAPPLVLGVTVLTSMNDSELAQVGIDGGVEPQVRRLAQLAQGCGLQGLVCSPLELAPLRACLSPECQLVTPGIRTGPPRPGDDQQRTLGPAEAVNRGAHWIVVGRPIYAATDPAAAAAHLLELLGYPLPEPRHPGSLSP